MSRKEPLKPLPLLVRLLALPMLLAAVSGCSQKILVCPVPAILADARSVAVMRPGTPSDLANELYRVTMTNAEGDCVYDQRTQVVRSSLDLTFHATRAPSRDAATYSVPYFVVVNENAKVFAKRLYNLNVYFAPGAVTADIKESPADVSIQIGAGRLPWNYEEVAGFQLTPEQIDYNRLRSRYLP